MASLVASERLARAGYDVSVFEKDAYEIFHTTGTTT